ncbi:MAG: TIGR03915 family putative DNA repair protein [Lachnospiraceae bacterium]|nr:TIGR03915 family putative DNA repair protein [Lachnospiraceae bacterium]MDE7178086.1 TIGR03915 family putative DNA repair protein [Lachnospiraceae bacterium]
MNEKYLICEDSLEGIFTGIYEAYALRQGHEHIHLQIGEEENLRLFAEYMYIVPDSVKTDKVARTLKTRLGEDVYHSLCCAAASCQPDKGEAIYRTVVDALTAGSGRRVMENLKNPHVARCFELARFTANEAHLETEFLRFQELASSGEEGVSVLFAKIGPKNNVVPFLMPHFADRLSIENFMVYDEKRKLFGVHPAREDWYLVTAAEGFSPEEADWSAKEQKYQELFRAFHRTIAIKSRENRNLQRQMCAYRYQNYMVEFEQNAKN